MTSHPPPTLDRRVQRTRDALLESLRLLMMERGYERLTIQNLLEHAGVSRATFYAHFSSKDDLLAESVQGLRQWLLYEAARYGNTRLAFTRPFFEHLESHRDIYRQTVRRGEVTVGRAIRGLLRELIRDDLVLATGSPADSPQLHLTAEYLTGALWSTIAYWMTTDPLVPAVDVDRQFRRLVFSGVPGAAVPES